MLTRRHILTFLSATAMLAATAFRPQPGRAAVPLPLGPKAPALSGDAKEWLNTGGKALTARDLRGKVVLVDFWEYTCVNCIRTLPYLKEWHKRYADKGLVIVGIHTPEFEFAKERENVVRSARQFGLEYPILLDSDYRNWRAFSNQYWPAKYLLDKEGRARYVHFGEGAYGETEAAIQALLRDLNPRVQLPKLMEPIRGEDKPGAVCYRVTPELYCGYERGLMGAPEGFRANRVVTYGFRGGDLEDGRLYPSGPWLNGPESLRHARATTGLEDSLTIRYHALGVNAVIKPEGGKPYKVFVWQDGKPVAKEDRGADIREEDGKTYLLIEQPRMYEIVKNAKFGSHILRLASDSPDFGIYAFTFTSCTVAEE
jgi:thiol-disulfide isomerase/thioredoxin